MQTQLLVPSLWPSGHRLQSKAFRLVHRWRNVPGVGVRWAAEPQQAHARNGPVSFTLFRALCDLTSHPYLLRPGGGGGFGGLVVLLSQNFRPGGLRDKNQIIH